MDVSPSGVLSPALIHWFKALGLFFLSGMAR